MNGKKDQKVILTGMTQVEMEDFVRSAGKPSYRGRQLYHWIYDRNAATFDAMRNIPGNFRTTLEQIARVRSTSLIRRTGDRGKITGKYLVLLADGNHVETVIMADRKRHTVCLSSQVGCALGCTFCATARMKLVRNLTAGEIIEQLMHIRDAYPYRITNVVFMGMGEPFQNYSNVMKAAELLSDENGIGLGARRITISTAGITPKIRRFTDERRRYKLAISLNGSNQKDRENIMPVSGSFAIDKLLDSVRYYYAAIKRQPTFEYVLLAGINDAQENAAQLMELIGDLPCKVNIIPYNEIGNGFKKPSSADVERFLTFLEDAPFTVTVRWSRGTDIDAGCGQLVTERMETMP